MARSHPTAWAVAVIYVTPANEPITIEWLPGVYNLTWRDLIHRMTARSDDDRHEVIARSVLSVGITHDAAFVRHGVVLIDSPGTNAYGIAAEGVRDANVAAEIANQADAAIILLPADKIVTNTLTEFINETRSNATYTTRFS